MTEKLSAATLRARNYTRDDEWYCSIITKDITGDLAEDRPGMVRRDPTAVIEVDGTYHTWYSRSTGKSYGFGTGDPDKKTFPWDHCEIWHATSKDGWHWEEQEVAVTRGEAGTYDDRSVFTPEVLAHDGRYYLVYQVVKSPYVRRSFEGISMAAADSPFGPWEKAHGPLLFPTMDGIWKGDGDNRFLVEKMGGFDSHKTHDPTLMFYNGKFYLYYKGEAMGERMGMGGRQTKWGVAIADKPEGPYVRSEYNPVTNSGHEVCVWHYNGGIAAMLTTDGPERNTLQWAPDGINFEIMAYIKGAPEANGLFRCDNHDDHPLEGLRWGLCHVVDGQGGYMKRFEVDERLKNFFRNRENYE